MKVLVEYTYSLVVGFEAAQNTPAKYNKLN